MPSDAESYTSVFVLSLVTACPPLLSVIVLSLATKYAVQHVAPRRLALALRACLLLYNSVLKIGQGVWCTVRFSHHNLIHSIEHVHVPPCRVLTT